MSETKATSAKADAPKSAATPKQANIKLPELSDLLKAGVQFGHQTKKWNPQMRNYIFSKRADIHIIDIAQTMEALQEAVNTLARKASEGNILFVGTKRQASDIVKEAAVDAGAYYISHRWPGGLFSNFDMIKRSLKKFNTLETEFEQGVEGRTKFEVSQMKKDWEKMNRIYEGIKTMDKYPSAVVFVDTNFEKNAVKEARDLNILTIGLVDTNCDPADVDIAIPSNDDAIQSIKLLVGTLAKAVKIGNAGKGVKHNLKDYTDFEVQLIKPMSEEEKDEVEVPVEPGSQPKVTAMPAKVAAPKKKKAEGKGLLESMQKESEEKKRTKANKTRT